MSVSSDGTGLSLTASQDGSTPQLYFTTQSGRDKPSYRFELTARSLSPGKTINARLDLAGGRLSFNSDDPRKTSFGVMMRRTNPGGARRLTITRTFHLAALIVTRWTLASGTVKVTGASTKSVRAVMRANAPN